MMTADPLLQGIISDPLDESRWLVLADWVEEHDDPRRAELLRLHRRLLATCTAPDEHPGRAEWQARIVALLNDGVQPVMPRQTITLGYDVEMTFVWIPPGAFLMGSPYRETNRYSDEVLHQVTLPRGFWMGIYPVTQAQWQAVMDHNPSNFVSDNLPVENVSWNDCQEFLSRRGDFRLPNEAEWEFACRAGTTTPFWWGDKATSHQANFDGNYPYGGAAKGPYLKQTSPVGSYLPNPFGLYDMHGNVWEWCTDLWRNEHSADPIPDQSGAGAGTAPPGSAGRRAATGRPSRSGAATWASALPVGEHTPYRVFRGGSWYDHGRDCRSACRDWGDPSDRFDSLLGFRLARA